MEPIKRQTLHQKIYENLKMMILSGDIAPGTKLNETSVAKEMNTSTTPVREAFRLLESEGFVRMEPWKGIIVQEYNIEEVESVYQCREALEVLGIDLTIERLKNSENREEEVEKINREIALSENCGSIDKFVDINSGIHNSWIEGSGNLRLKSMMDSLNDVLIHDRNLSAMDEQRKKEIISEHIAILKAIRDLDKEKAKEALHKHIKNGLDYSINKLKTRA